MRNAWCAVAATVGMFLVTAAAPAANAAEHVYVRCKACHALATDRVGPRHCGLFGRKAGSVPGFSYSPAMKKSGIVWNEKTLDKFLQSPLKMVPGTAMTYDGVTDAGERADLLGLHLMQKHNGQPNHR